MAQIGVVTKVDTDPPARDEQTLTRFGLDSSRAVFHVNDILNY